MIEALDIQVRGIVQGVGFRPFVYRMAKKYLINGWVLNATDGVFIHAEGEGKLLDEFVLELSENPPAASQVDEIELKEVPLEGFDSFEIRFSDAGAVEKTTLISPDLATCEDCVHELFNPNDPRYRYPFINCTNCGPRFTIIEKLPYDRKNTSMKEFPMCPRCQSEYDEPLDRRFHAQPNACFECGPKVSWRVTEAGGASGAEGTGAGAPADARAGDPSPEWGTTREESDAIFAKAVEFLRAGKILAVKGLGGFHLVCDAENEQAVAELRRRKRREGKAFAVMMKDIASVREVCRVNESEERLLTGSQRPIVLLRKRPDAAFVPGLADGLAELGVMLPYTPVQHLLLHDFDGMLVMTSGNIHDEPIVTDDDEAYRVLGSLADAILGNNRAIRARYDDSVIRVLDIGQAGCVLQFVRRARGYAPMPLALPELASGPVDEEASGEACADKADEARSASADGTPSATAAINPPSIFATGPEQKNTFCLTRENEAFVSQHIGDMENAETYDAWLAAKALYERLFEITPERIACDLHPEYLTSKWAHEQDLPVVEVQHHHAHIVSVMAENKLYEAVAGFAFDGTGFGADGTIWGGEVLLSNLSAYERFANFAYIPMPGGAAAIKNPLRMAYGVLWAFDLLDHPAASAAIEGLGEAAEVCAQMIERGLNTPLTSSVGRLFDAASAMLGICTEPKYEGEGAILLEAAISSGNGELFATYESPQEASGRYAIDIVKNTATAKSTALDTSVVLYDAASTFKALLDDLADGVPRALIAQRFHDAFVMAIVQGARLIRATYGIDVIALSGGVFLNRYLMEHAIPALTEQGFTVAVNRDLPPSDGCISFGQAVVGLRL
ncbi:carbamoyltransferase HypF [Raoultibacter phocaeensis]|uniref:carbamoyltransferase HypF n=1 Tax=Raoultibacter phocaeensis TaxID=2479841 RepID=UPI0011186F74|nr:carbamoyltransferase HypF [Raoultibacter phocaeensis]